MVVHSVSEEKNLPLPTVGKTTPAFQGHQTPSVALGVPPSADKNRLTAVRSRRGRKCCFVTSLTFNIVLIVLLIVAGVFLCRHRNKMCKLQIRHDKEILRMKGNVGYKVKGCHAYERDLMIDDFWPDGPAMDAVYYEEENPEGDIEDEMPAWRDIHDRPRFPHGRPYDKPGPNRGNGQRPQ